MHANTGIMRTSDYPINPLILKRHSPRAMSGEPVTKQELMQLFEAARWAPSSFNNQPWRFVYGFRDTPAWDKLFALLVPANQVWVTNGAVLVLAISSNLFSYNNKLSRTHSFDTGAACENFALQGNSQGFVIHGMEGFDYDAARRVFNIPDTYTVEAMFCVGKPGDPQQLPEKLRAGEEPNGRKPVAEFAFEGQFKDA